MKMSHHKGAAWMSALCATAALCKAATLEVPSGFATIEAALAAAQPGDTIEVAPDNYMLANYDGIIVPAGVTLAGTGAAPTRPSSRPIPPRPPTPRPHRS